MIDVEELLAYAAAYAADSADLDDPYLAVTLAAVSLEAEEGHEALAALTADTFNALLRERIMPLLEAAAVRLDERHVPIATYSARARVVVILAMALAILREERTRVVRSYPRQPARRT